MDTTGTRGTSLRCIFAVHYVIPGIRVGGVARYPWSKLHTLHNRVTFCCIIYFTKIKHDQAQEANFLEAIPVCGILPSNIFKSVEMRNFLITCFANE